MWNTLKSGLNRTRDILFTDVGDLFDKGSSEPEQLLEDLENRLLLADVGVEATEKIISGLRDDIKRQKPGSADETLELLKQQMVSMLKSIESPLFISADNRKPMTLLVVGVNGAGKTTTIGKLTNLLKKDHKILLAAGDTFRAAAIDQLKSWGKRNSVPVVAKEQGADSASVIYDALVEAREKGFELIIADTAGRLQNKSNLVEELKKIRRTINKHDPHSAVATLLIIDAGTGQNALNQASQFNTDIGIDGLIITKLDGTAKGGIIFAIAEKLAIPLHYIGTGESIDDISRFSAEDFVSALLSLN